MRRVGGAAALPTMVLALAGCALAAAAEGELLFDVQPVTLEGRTLVPLRPISDWLGAEITYDEGHIEVYRSSIATVPQVELWVGSTRAKIAEADYALDVPPQLINGRCFVPLRFVAESFGVWVEAEGRQMKLSLPQENRMALLAIPPHPQTHLGKIWRVIERWYDVLPPGEQQPPPELPHWSLYSQARQDALVEEIGDEAPSITEERWGGREVEGIRVLDGRVGPGAETGWADVMVGWADESTEVNHFEFVREPRGWRVDGVTTVEPQ